MNLIPDLIKQVARKRQASSALKEIKPFFPDFTQDKFVFQSRHIIQDLYNSFEIKDPVGLMRGLDINGSFLMVDQMLKNHQPNPFPKEIRSTKIFHASLKKSGENKYFGTVGLAVIIMMIRPKGDPRIHFYTFQRPLEQKVSFQDWKLFEI